MNTTKGRIAVFFFTLSILFVFSSSFALADNVQVNISEGGKIVSYYDEYYIYQLNGTVEVYNPSNLTVYNIELPIYVSTLAVRTNYTKEGNFLTPNKLFIYALDPNSSEIFHYRLLGISTEDLSTNNESVLANGIVMFQPKIYSNLFGTLKKAPFEDSGVTGNTKTRLISVELRNPTDFVYNIDKVEVIKSSGLDMTIELDKWDFTGQKAQLQAREGWDFDFADTNATEGEVYWLSTDIYLDEIEINQKSNITRFDQDDLFEVLSNTTLNVTINETIEFLSNRVYLRKLVTKTLMVPGEVVDITVIVNNLEPKDIELTVHDPLPKGFDVLSVEKGRIVNDTAEWDVSLSSGTAKRLRYQVKYTNNDLLGVDYFMPAYLDYRGDTVYSQSIPFVRKYIPEKKVFIQKKVNFLSGEEVQVTLSVQNMGETKLKKLMIKEALLSTAEFREISKPPTGRGMWTIEELNQSATWETTYITDKMSVLNAVPDVYGVAQSSVLQTIILSNEISSRFKELPTNFIEILGILALVIILGLYFLPASFFSRTRKHQKKELRSMAGEIRTLHNKTSAPQESLHKHSSVIQPPRQAQIGSSEQSRLQDPARVARHEALDSTKEDLERVKKTIKGDEEEKEIPGLSEKEDKK